MELPDSEQTAKGTRDWPHAPPHRLAEAGVYFVTARTRDQLHLLAEDSMKDWFEAKLLELARSSVGEWKRGVFSRTTTILLLTVQQQETQPSRSAP